jgi:PAS domain S-box-containing protein
MDYISQPKLEIGYGAAHEENPFSAGMNAADQAIKMIHASPTVAVVVFASVQYDLKEVLRGVRCAVPNALLFGCTTACEILNGPLHGGIVVTVLASSHMKVSFGLGRNVSENWQIALHDAINAPAIHPYFHDIKYWQDLTLKGKSAFAVLFSPGNTSHSSSQSYEILEAIKLKSLGRLPVFGGSTADDWSMETNYVLLDGEAFPDSMLLAVFETQLQFGIAMDHGFMPTIHQTTVTRAEGHEVLELDGEPAADIYARIVGSTRAALEGKHLAMTTGNTMGTADTMGQYSINVASFITPNGGIYFTQPVTASTVLTLMEPDSENMLFSGQEALRKAILRGGITGPALTLVAYSTLRPRIAGNQSYDEISVMAEMLAGSPLVGFCSFGEQGVADDGTVRHNSGVISVLVLGRDLSPNARVALENEKLRETLELQAIILSETNQELLTEVAERKRIESTLLEAHDKLETRVKERTAELARSNEQLLSDIAERKKAEEDLWKSENILLKIFDSIPELLSVIDRDLRIVRSNWHGGYEYVPEELRNKSLYCYEAYYPGQNKPCENCHTIEVFRTGKPAAMEKINPQIGIVEMHAYPVLDDAGNVIMAIEHVRDITERKKMEMAVQESEELFRTLCNSAPIGIFRADCDGNIIYINPHWEKISGLLANESLGKGWIRAVHPEDRETKGKIWLESVAARKPCSQEYRLMNPKGKTILIRTQASPIMDQNGNCIGYVGIVEDITERRQAIQDMTRTQKLESLGVLAGGIAHDFNNILTAILGNISLARIQLQFPDKVTRRLAEAENAAARAKDLTQQLLTFARGGEPVKQIIKVESLLKETAGFACHGSAVKCEFVLPDKIWPVEADEGQLFQVINNLVLNAVQAMPGGGIVTIGAENDSSRLEGKRSVKIFVTDSGTGIPDHHVQRIFDPYFTTKQNGSGLGLATCFSIIKKHDGIITFESTLCKGTTFYVYLPASEQGRAVDHDAEMEVMHGSGRILVMDDDEEVSDIAQAILEELGYLVECTKNGTDTVDLYRKRKEEGTPFAAVIMDLTIPGGMGGKEAIEKLLRIDPNIKAIVSSGYSTDPVMANYQAYGFIAVLRKPYRPQEIGKVLQELLAL